jgi:hypothetical protein
LSVTRTVMDGVVYAVPGNVLTRALDGHALAIPRLGALLAGDRDVPFNVFRNTYKPLLAESVVEFWNRYYFYFKELLMEFFFLPTYARWFRTWPRLRLFAAVFAAAFFGNMYYHLIQNETVLVPGDVVGAWEAYNSRLLYCALLAFGIFVSMLRAQQPKGEPISANIGLRLVRIFGVWTFFGLIYIWEVKSSASFVGRTQFFLSLFGLA